MRWNVLADGANSARLFRFNWLARAAYRRALVRHYPAGMQIQTSLITGWQWNQANQFQSEYTLGYLWLLEWQNAKSQVPRAVLMGETVFI